MPSRLGSMLRRLAASAAAPAPAADLLAELRSCVARRGGERATRRRVDALVARHAALPPEGRAGLAAALDRLSDDEGSPSGRYADIEAMELFGRSSSKLAVLDALAPPRRRMLALIREAAGGPGLLRELRRDASGGLAADIDAVLSGD